MNECSAYVGVDVHKDTIAVAVALPVWERGRPARSGPKVRGRRSDWLSMRAGRPRSVSWRYPLPAAVLSPRHAG